MECSCSVDYDDLESDFDDWETTLNVYSHSENKCCECNCIIPQMREYTIQAALRYDDCQEEIVEQKDFIFCNDCHVLTNNFFTGGYYFGQIYSDVNDMIIECDGKVSENIISQLSKSKQDWICGCIEDCWEDE